MTCEVSRLNPAFLDQEWPKVSPMLDSGFMYSEGELDISQLRMLCARGDAFIMVCMAEGQIIGALALEIVQYPNFRAANVISAGGRGIYNAKYWEMLRAWLKDMGVSKVQGNCRPSVARLLKRMEGFRTAYELVRADI